ncbi:MAG: AI-2E family transporter, partial [Phycisphaerae bacterium]|nr:AI-2E family transporter [Phycisphaerae bacterium]
MTAHRGKPTSPESAPKDWRHLHLWQIQPLRDVLFLLAVFGIIWLGYKLSIVTVPLLLAMAFAYLFEPLVQSVTRRGYVSRQGTALSIIVFAAVIVVVPLILGGGFAVLQGISVTRSMVTNVQALQASVENPEDAALLEALPKGGWRSIREYIIESRAEEAKKHAPAPSETRGDATSEDGPPPDEGFDLQSPIEERAQTLIRETTSWLFRLMQSNSDAIGRFLGRQAVGTGADAAVAAFNLVKNIGYLLFTGFLTAFFFFFFCTGYGRVLRFWESLIPERRKDRVFNLLGQMDHVIAAFIRGRLTICAILMGYYTLAYWLVGVPAPLILGPIIGALAILPYVGGVGLPIAMLLMWLQPPLPGWQGEWWWNILGPILISVGSQTFDDYVLTPAIQGKNTGMDIPTIVFASIAGGTLAGV